MLRQVKHYVYVPIGGDDYRAIFVSFSNNIKEVLVIRQIRPQLFDKDPR